MFIVLTDFLLFEIQYEYETYKIDVNIAYISYRHMVRQLGARRSCQL